MAPPPSPSGAALTSLHRVKLRRPATADHYVRRERLLDLLDDVARHPLTLVVAPAGTGKTSLVAGWAAESSVPHAWLSLDENDRDVVQFWSSAIAALEPWAPGCGDAALAMLRRHDTRAGAVDRLVVDLEALALPLAALIIDDFHLVDEDEIVVESVSQFVQNLPDGLRVIVLSRRDPKLPLNRMRSRGQLAEIRFAELRFSPDEAVELMTRLSPPLSGDQVEVAVERADGWATSLQLTALAARTRRARTVQAAPGHDDDVLVQDYVVHEVLANEASEVIDVLSAVAVVTRVNSSLAVALTDRPDAGELLERAEERGLFVTRRGSGGWFELHALVRGTLTSDLANRSPTRLTDLHTRAARWFEASNELVDALEQWLLADRPLDALRLLSASHGRLYDSGREVTVKRVIAAIPAAAAVSDLQSMIDYAWCHLLVDRRRFVALVDQLKFWVDRSPPTAVLRARVDQLRASAAVVSGRWVEHGALCRQVIADLGASVWQDPLGRFAANGVARELALSERWDDAADEVRHAELLVSRDPERHVAFEGTRALGDALAGRPLDALRVAAGVRRVAQVADMTILRAELDIAEAVARRELGDRKRATAELLLLVDIPVDTMVFCRILAMCELVQAHLDAGDLDGARALFARTEALVEEEALGSDVRGWLARLGVVLALADGDDDGAQRWSDRVEDPFWRGVSQARVHLSTGERSQAMAAVDHGVPRCPRHEALQALLKARASADHDEELEHIGDAVRVASTHGLLQTIASEGAEVVELIERAPWLAPAEWLDRLRRASADPRDRSTPHETGLIEPLTDREREVLRFLPSRLTVREIADELYVSVNTVKFHLRVIYRKLGVNSREEAAEAARSMTKLQG